MSKADRAVEHLRAARDYCYKETLEQPRLRDQTMMFYMAVLAAFVAIYGKISAGQLIVLTIMMSFIGLVCFMKIAGHRMWNIQYVEAAKLINGLLLSDKDQLSGEEIQQFVHGYTPNYPHDVKSLFVSVGNLTAVGFSLVTTAPVLITAFSMVSEPLSLCATILICIAYVIVYCTFCIWYLLKRIRPKKSRYNWLLEIPGQESNHK